MTGNVDMSFDEIIKQNKSRNKSARGGRGGLLKNLARRSEIAGRGGRGGQQASSTCRSSVKLPNKQLRTGARSHISNLDFAVSKQHNKLVMLLDQKFANVRNLINFSPMKLNPKTKINIRIETTTTSLIDVAARYYAKLGKTLSDFYMPEETNLNLNFFRIKRPRSIVCLPLLEARIDQPENKLRQMKKKLKTEKKCVRRELRRESRKIHN